MPLVSRFRGQLRCRLCSFTAAFLKPHDDNVENWREEKTEPSDTEHSEENSGAEGLTHFRTGSAADYKRKDTENKSEGSHQNWTQAQAARFDCGGEPVFAIAILDLLCELNDEDGVLAGEPDENNKADLGKDVVLH